MGRFMGRFATISYPNLRRKHRNWHVRKAVPTDLRDVIGRNILEATLGTDALDVAIPRRNAQLAAWEQMFEDARRQQLLGAAELNRIRQKAELRAWGYLQGNPEHGAGNLRRMEDAASRFPQGDQEQATGMGVTSALARFERNYPAPAPLEEKASEIPVETLVEKWLDANLKGRRRSKPLRPKTASERRSTVGKFAHWLKSRGIENSVQTVTKSVANRFIEEAYEVTDSHPRTANKQIRSLSSYWRYLIQQEVAKRNPWEGQSLEEPVVPESERKRPFTDDEIRRLFAGDPGQPLADVMKIAFFTGMRINEICELKVGNCANGLFRITDSKTNAGLREVPIHSGLEKLVTARTADRDGKAYLISELKTPADGASVKRSNPLVKKFKTFRESVGVDDVVGNSRVSRVTFHSFRNIFAHRAEDALGQGVSGFTYDTIQDVMGHSRTARQAGLTKGYAGPSGLDARRACVEAVRLPEADV